MKNERAQQPDKPENVSPFAATNNPKSEISNPKCAKCGACTSVCPIYQITGEEHLTARGRMHLLSRLTSPAASKQFVEIFSKCLLCGACRHSCPRSIDIPAAIINARHDLPQVTGFPSFKKFLVRKTIETPLLLRILTKVGRALGLLPKALPKESGLHLSMTVQKDRTPKAQPFHDRPYPPSEQHPKKALYFTGCLANYLAADIANATSLLLDKVCRHQPITPAAHCCGMATFAAGDLGQARELAKKNISLFSTAAHATLPIVTSCATCFSHLSAYPSLFDQDSEWRQRATDFSDRVCEFSRFMLCHGKDGNILHNDDLPETVLYYDPCHLRFHMDKDNKPDPVTREARELLGRLPNTTLVSLTHGPQCCGQGGLFHLAHPDLAATMTEKAITDLKSIAPDYLLTTCSGCLVRWRQGVTQTVISTKVEHLAPFLAKRILHP